MRVCYCSMYCCTLLCVHSSIAIILMGKRELIALLNLSSWCLVMVERLFLTVPWGCLQFVIVVFPDHTHLLFFTVQLSQLIRITVQLISLIELIVNLANLSNLQSNLANLSNLHSNLANSLNLSNSLNSSPTYPTYRTSSTTNQHIELTI